MLYLVPYIAHAVIHDVGFLKDLLNIADFP
jgi:hypothetical protein